MPPPEDALVSRSCLLHLVSLKCCTEVRHEYHQVIQSSEASERKPTSCEDLAVGSQHSLLQQRPYNSRRNALRQDRPGSGPGKENMNSEDGTELCHKKTIPCDRPSMRSSMRSSMRMTCGPKSPPTMTFDPQMKPLYLSADQHRALASTKIERCYRTPVASLKQLPFEQSLQSSKGTVNADVKYGPEKTKDNIILRDRIEARQMTKQPCRKLTSQPVSSSAASFIPTLAPPPNVPYSSLGAGKFRPRVLVDSLLNNLELVTVDLANSVMDHDLLGTSTCGVWSAKRITVYTVSKPIMHTSLPENKRFPEAWGSKHSAGFKAEGFSNWHRY